MYRYRLLCSLLVLSSMDIVAFANVSTSKTNEEQKLKEALKANRLFQLPNVLALEQALSEFQLDYFLEKTNLLHKIADRHLNEAGIHLAVELAYYDFYKYLENNMPNDLMIRLATMHKDMKPFLIETIIRASKEVEKDQ